MALNSLIRSLVQHRFCKNTSTIFLQKYSSQSLRLVCCYSSSSEDRKKKINTFVLTKYTNYIRNFENVLSKRFPKAMTVYRGFMDGVKLFSHDLKQYVKILAKVNGSGKGFHELTRNELEIYNRIPREMVKLAPVLIGSALPLGYAVLLPLSYLFPKVLLTEYFWTPEQKEKFGKDTMYMRLRHGKAIINLLTGPNVCLQKHVADDKLWLLVQAEIKTNQLFYPHRLIGCIDLFKGMPFHLDKLSRIHIMHLAKLHDISTFWFPKKKLKQRAQIMMAMDRAIIREGGIKKLSLADMRKVCRLRGLYAEEMDQEEMKQWLNKWMHISVSADDNSLSFLLHSSAILGYNMPTNKKILKSRGGALDKLRINSRAALKHASTIGKRKI